MAQLLDLCLMIAGNEEGYTELLSYVDAVLAQLFNVGLVSF